MGKTRRIRENGFRGFFRGLDEGVGGIQFSPGLGGAELEQVVAGDRAQLCCKGAGGTGLYGDAGLRVFVQGDEDGCAAQVFYLEGQPRPRCQRKDCRSESGSPRRCGRCRDQAPWPEARVRPEKRLGHRR